MIFCYAIKPYIILHRYANLAVLAHLPATNGEFTAFP